MSAPGASGTGPTGRQHEITAGPHRAVVTEVGATLREYSCDGRALIAGFGVDQRSSAGRGQQLAPWPNRIRDGRYFFDGHEYQLPIDEPARSNAIHGLVRWSPWALEERSDTSVTLGHTIYPRDGYPFLLELRTTYSVAADSALTVRVEAHNKGPQACPFAYGAHPYLHAGPAPVDGWEIELPAASRLVTDDRAIPTGREPVEGSPFDFRRPRPVGATVLDTCFTDLERDARGQVGVTLAGGRLREPAVTLWMDERFPYVMLFSADTLHGAERRASLAVEPMTSPPDAFRSGEALIRLEPDASWSGSWGIRPG